LQQEIRSTREFAQALYNESPARTAFLTHNYPGISIGPLSNLNPAARVMAYQSGLARAFEGGWAVSEHESAPRAADEAKPADESTSASPATPAKDST
jgi:hypothetical protein